MDYSNLYQLFLTGFFIGSFLSVSVSLIGFTINKSFALFNKF